MGWAATSRGRPTATAYAEAMQQAAPLPEQLCDLVADLRYKAGWTFSLEDRDRGQGCRGLTLCILIDTPGAYDPGRRRQVMHYMPVPAAAYDRQSWRRWLLEQVLLVERHEACEFFQIGNGRPYAPNHGPGRDPYVIFDYATDVDRRTSFRGEVQSA